MLKTILLTLNANKSIKLTNAYKVYQGEANVYKFIIDPSLVLTPDEKTTCLIGFKRPDNRLSGYILAKKEDDGTYSYVIKDHWTLNVVGQLGISIEFFSNDEVINPTSGRLELVGKQNMYSGSTSLYINPLADYTLVEDLPPSNVVELQNQIDELNDKSKDIPNKLNKDFTTYPALEHKNIGSKDLLALNKITDTGVEQYNIEAKDLYNEVNSVKPDDNGNIHINSNDIPYKDTIKNVTQELDNKLNKDDNVVHYEESPEDVGYPLVSFYRADYADKADKDTLGNVIIETYATKEQVKYTLLWENPNPNSPLGFLNTSVLHPINIGDTIHVLHKFDNNQNPIYTSFKVLGFEKKVDLSIVKIENSNLVYCDRTLDILNENDIYFSENKQKDGASPTVEDNNNINIPIAIYKEVI